MSNKAPAFQFYAGDFLSSPDVIVMSAQEVGAYCLLLFTSWQSEKRAYLDNDEDRLRRIAKAMRLRFPELMTSRVQLIARTQAAMASSMLTQSRAEDLNLRWLEWDTSSDQRVRPSHRAMNGVLLTWNDPPSPEALIGIKSSLGAYLPGQAPNCRCIPAVLLSADDVTWPRKVYQAGAIHQMTRAKFQQLTGVPNRLAA